MNESSNLQIFKFLIMEKQKNSVGRRKEAVTRVFISRGNGAITVNEKDYKVYFPLVYLQNQVERPLKTVEAADKFDIKINAAGGGVKGQAEAAMLGIARVLVDLNPDFRPALKAAGLLKRDPRSVERKKFGKKKARRSYQFSKR
jgi:small subunit ribosomal protein S9